MNDPPVLYQRAKASDMLQGLSDMIDIMELEVQKFSRWHGAAYQMILFNGLNEAFNQISQLRNRTYQLQQCIQVLRDKGL